MKITLTEPVSHGGKTYRRVRLRLPRSPSAMEDSCPPHITPEIWNASVLTGLPIQAAVNLTPTDLVEIGGAFMQMITARATGGRFQ